MMKHPFNSSFASFLWVALFSLLTLTNAIRADDWPQWRGPNRDGISKERGWLTDWPASGPRKLWEASVGIATLPVRSAKAAFTPWVMWRRTTVSFVSTPR